METKEQLIAHIREWLQIDNDIRVLQAQMREKRLVKKHLTDQLVEVMKDNEIDCFDIKGGKLQYTQNKYKAPLSKKHLLTALTDYFETDATKAEEVSQYIMETRDIKIKDAIKRTNQK